MGTKIQRTVIADDITVDCVLNENHQHAVEITQHPVEEGADVTDHARQMPIKLTLEIIHSNTPDLQDDAKALEEDERAPFGHGPAQKTWDRLIDLLNARQLINVATSAKSYSNMMLLSVVAPFDSKTGDAVRMTLTLQQIRLVKTETVRLELVSRPNAVPEKPTKKTDQGKKPTQPQPETTENKSILKGLTDDLTERKVLSGPLATTDGSGVNR